MKKICFVIVSLLFASSVAYAESSVLKSHLRYSLPKSTETVAEAINYLVKPYGYRFYAGPNAPKEARVIASSLAERNVKRGALVSIEEALLGTISEDVKIYIDNELKLITVGYMGGDAQ